jgi:two-component system, NarL family, sensor kinase
MRAGDVVTLSISDEGDGFERNLLSASGGLGLIMMRERAGQLNGTFEFQTAPGRGTSIKVVIPFR